MSQVRTKKCKKLTRPKVVIDTPLKPNKHWSMDFVSDQLSNGRRFRVFNVVGDFPREMIGKLVSISISGQQVARFLNTLINQRGKPQVIVCDNGPEFTSKAMFWSEDSGVRLSFIQPGKLTQNAFVESLNGKFRDSCFNQHWFRSFEEAKKQIEQWHYHYNHERLHSSLNYMMPVAFAKRAT